MMDTIKAGSSMNVLTPPALRTREAVLEVLEQIRSDGYYISIGERKHPR